MAPRWAVVLLVIIAALAFMGLNEMRFERGDRGGRSPTSFFYNIEPSPIIGRTQLNWPMTQVFIPRTTGKIDYVDVYLSSGTSNAAWHSLNWQVVCPTPTGEHANFAGKTFVALGKQEGWVRIPTTTQYGIVSTLEKCRIQVRDLPSLGACPQVSAGGTTTWVYCAKRVENWSGNDVLRIHKEA